MTCKAPDCEKDAEFTSGYCSTVCMNVDLAVASRIVADRTVSELPDEEVAEIRRDRQASHDEIMKKVNDE